MESEPDHENVEQSLCAKTAEEELNKSFNLEASLSKFSYIDLDKELEFKNDLIDDKEFDIPQVDTPPTLESILNETDDEDESFVLEDPTLLNIDTIDSHSYDTSSVASSDSGDRTNLKRKKKLLDSFSLHGSVMRHSLLKGISAQIVSAADKVDAGLPTAIAVSSLIAVGTSHGLALIFGKDQNQALRLCLGSTSVGGQYGAISALSINNDCSRLLCGFAKGQVTMWDLASGKLLRSITDAHPPGTAILHIKFTDDPTLAICNDSGGSVFELTFKRVMGVRTCESRCLFSGSKGEVCCIEPLHSKPELKDHPITQFSLLAMASLTKILVIGLKPSLKVWMTFPYGRMDPSSVPLLAWHFVAVHNYVNPMLAFCRGDVVHFLLVKRDESGAIHVTKQKHLHLYYDLINFTWINSRTVVLLDSVEKLHVIDRQTQEELETVEISEVQLVYNSSHFKSLATGGNVSQALALVGEKACYQSISSYGGQIFYLGTKSVYVMMLRSWRERVDHLLKQDCLTEALALAWSFHEGKAKAVVGLSGDVSKRKAIVADRMVEILFHYADRALKKCPDQGKIQVMEQHFQDMVPVIVDYCLLLQRKDLLFSQMYDKLSENSVAKGVFLECLEPYILSDKLVGITPQVMKDLIVHFQDKKLMENVEALIVHMDITSLDIQQVVLMCWENRLYDAMIYVYNRGMNEFISPMEKLFRVIAPPLNAGKTLTDEQVVMGNKLLVYISCCLAGRAYPLGDIPEDLVPLVKNQVFEFLIRLHSAEASPEEEIYPYIRTLLHFDTREFLNVLALTFEDFKNDKQAVEYQQRIVDILLKVMVENSDFTPSQVGCLFTFLARQLAKPDNTLFVNRTLFDQVLEFLCSPDDDSRHSERQQVLLELLQAGGIVQFEESRLIRMAEKAEFYQICEFMYEREHQYDKIIDCYLHDPLREEEVFNYIHNILSIPGHSAEEKQSVWQKAMDHIEELVALKPCKAAELVATHFSGHIETVIKKLQNQVLLFKFLRSLLDPREGIHINQELLQISPCITEQFIELLCQFSPNQVIETLQVLECYRLEETIQISQKYQLHEVTAYLLEKKGDIHGAFLIMLERLQSKLQELTHQGENTKEDPSLKDVEDTMVETIALCQRNSHNLNQQQREALWFPLLEAMMAPQKLSSSAVPHLHSEALKSLTMQVLNSMAAFIALPSILQRILQDPVYGKGKLGEIQGLILGMLDTFNYEQTLLETTTSLLNQDLHWSLCNLRASVTRGLNPKQDYCSICLQQYKRRQEMADEIIVFSCGHLYHSFCLQSKECTMEIEGQTRWTCYKCSSSNKVGKLSENSSEIKKGRITPSQVKMSPSYHQSKGDLTGKKATSEPVLDPQQIQAFDQLCHLYRGSSRLALLTELSQNRSSESYRPFSGSQGGPAFNSIFQNENFQLQLIPPPVTED
nr:vacuolar protein sorting-associated protein 8 homolog isoform X1 [Saimiri boliviensis boliviensis]XP_039334660.1 vacuolar protein sorting-associated protein 8 homolog isoform X1 [Saimiri boliviensis boliviensis]XP_039334661.1 vacuolar protein sorting-associated protein 8 homolog isoform X1 [Saimiri boliviensis boliviensis]XP_039334662.1 vacuolar protein sorting-associated protein 8 homolog isoform X1 [Saimiri boliviensis boliviensis]XP_039334663.1 vacuolar protein sorting-associated protein 